MNGFSFKGQGYGQLVDSTVTLSQLTVQLFSQTESGILFFARSNNPRVSASPFRLSFLSRLRFFERISSTLLYSMETLL